MTRVTEHIRAGVAAIACGLVAVLTNGCAKNVELRPLPLARGGTAEVKVELTYDRNNTLTVTMENLPQPASIKPEYTRYVLWAEASDQPRPVNVGQIRVDDKNNGKLTTLTPFRNFRLFITAETAGDAQAPGPDMIFEAPLTNW
jgi:hypothetical protein